MKKSFTLATKDGCRRWLAIFICSILLFSFAACAFSTSGFRVKIEKINVDARGAALNGELYYPSMTSDEDSLPAIVVAHGGGCAYGVMRGVAEELARRGFVVFNVSAYGSGLSEQPLYDEADNGVNEYAFSGNSPHGCLDAVDFLRSLKFVDTTRIGIIGHSAGSRRTCNAAVRDCGYYTYNDLMINVLADDFGQTFTEEEITKDAAELAAERLNPDELKLYQHRAQEIREYYDTRILAICPLAGSGRNIISPLQTVTVGGHEVLRNCQINIGYVNGRFDTTNTYPTLDSTKESWHTGTENINFDTWYVMNDNEATSTQIGQFGDAAVASSQEFQTAVENRTLRMLTENNETHSKNYFSNQANADIIRFFEATLRYNGGELGSASAKPIEATNQIWLYRAFCNAIAMFSMIGMLISLAALLMKTSFFAPVVAAPAKVTIPFNKKRYWLFGGITVVFTFLSIYFCCNGDTTLLFGFIKLPTNTFWPLFTSGWSATNILAYFGLSSTILLIAYSIIGKKTTGATGLKVLNVGMGIKSILKALLMAIILLAVGYLSLTTIEYLFGQDYRFWQTMFTEMKLEYWGVLPRYAFLSYLPCFLLIGMATNYTVRSDIPEWKDTLITIIINSAGIWICCLINILVLFTKAPGEPWQFFATFITYYYTVLFVPLTVYITRKMYKLTNSVWAGAFLNSLLAAWSIVSATGINMYYIGSTFGKIFFGF